MYMRLAFAVAAHLDTEILIVDECWRLVTHTQKKCHRKMQEVSGPRRTVYLSVQHGCYRALLPVRVVRAGA